MTARRQLLGALAATACSTLAAPALRAQGLVGAAGSAPVRLLVGFPPGGGTDAIARLLAEEMAARAGRPFIVENKAGAGGQLAAQALKAATPDGTTLFVSHDHTISILPLVTRNPGYDPARDFTPVAGFATFANAIALSPGTPARSLVDYLAGIRIRDGGKATVGIPAPASIPEFLIKVLAQRFKLDLVAAPYRGSGPMMIDMIGNQIGAGVGSVPDFIENHRAGRLHIVAVMGRQRQPMLPDVPTFAEIGVPGFEALPFYGLFAPAGTPEPTIEALGRALAQAIEKPMVTARLAALGLTVEAMPAEVLAARERAYAQAWARTIKETGFVAP